MIAIKRPKIVGADDKVREGGFYLTGEEGEEREEGIQRRHGRRRHLIMNEWDLIEGDENEWYALENLQRRLIDYLGNLSYLTTK